MYDEMVQSILIREELFFQNNKLKLNGYYPFENGEKLYKEMIRLGQFEDLTNYIDKLRVLLTQIGNVLG